MYLIIPVFLSHQGCPHGCIFCNQHRITGPSKPVDAHAVAATIDTWLGRRQKKHRMVQVGFYGGSFTALDQSRQRELLGAVRPYLQSGRVDTIRLSTRPDCLDPGRIALLRRLGVGIVEIGAQSLDDRVLARAGRGHTASQVEEATARLRQYGLEVGIQLMVGLPGDSARRRMKTVQRVIGMRPDFVRIYPLLVLDNTRLARELKQARYTPLSLDRAVVATARMKRLFDQAKIPVIRMGLQPTPSLEKSLKAGPFHPAFGELVLSRLMFLRARKALRSHDHGRHLILHINRRDLSIFNGPRGRNVAHLRTAGLLDNVTVKTRRRQQRHTISLTPE